MPAGESGFSAVALDANGEPVVSVERLAVRPVDPARLGAGSQAAHDPLHRLDWVEVPAPSASLHE